MSRVELVRVLNNYNKNPKAYSDQEAEMLARLASRYNIYMKRSSKAGQKFLFDLADTAVLGMIPNKWRPQARGDRFLGESTADRWAGGLGTATGLLGALPLAAFNVPRIIGGAGAVAGAASGVASRGANVARNIYSRMPDAGAIGTRVADTMARGRQFTDKFSSLNRGKMTAPFNNAYNRFMEPIRRQNLIDQIRRNPANRIGPDRVGEGRLPQIPFF